MNVKIKLLIIFYLITVCIYLKFKICFTLVLLPLFVLNGYLYWLIYILLASFIRNYLQIKI